VFKNPVSLTNAYGFSVATVMFSTTILIAIQMRFVKHWHLAVAIAFFCIFGFLDGLFWGAALKKIPQGAWVTLMIGVICMSLMSFWTWAKGLEDKLDTDQRDNLQDLISSSPNSPAVISEKDPDNLHVPHLQLEDVEEIDRVEKHTEGGVQSQGVTEQLEAVKYFIRSAQTEQGIIPDHGEKYDDGSTELVRLPTCAVFHRLNAATGVPPSFIGFVQKWPALPRVVIFLTVRPLAVARVRLEDRYSVHKIRAIEGFYGVTYFLGFRDTFDVELSGVIDRICSIEARHDPRGSLAIIEEVRRVARRSTHVVPHYLVVSKKLGSGRVWAPLNWLRSVLIEDVYRKLATLFPDTVNWFGPAVEVVQVGVNATI